MTSRDVIIVGGGAVGLAIAWRAAAQGLQITVVDPEPGRGASWAAAGMLAPVTELHPGEESLLRLTLASSDRWPAFARQLEEAAGQSIGYRRCGTLMVARDADENAALEDVADLQRSLGLTVERLPGRACRELEPALTPRVRGGILVSGDHQVDNRALVTALTVAVRRAGAELRSGRVTEVLTAGDRVRGVRLAGGEELTGDTVVLAAGSWSAQLTGIPAAAVPPIRPVKGQLLHLRGAAVPPLLTRNLRGAEVYLVPRSDGRLVAGASVEELGFDTTITAGAVHDLLRAAVELLPGVRELELTEVAVGLRPGSPDNAPLLGPTALEGLIAATGHYRNGILLTPVTADAVTRILTQGEVPDVIAAFSPLRFEAKVP